MYIYFLKCFWQLPSLITGLVTYSLHHYFTTKKTLQFECYDACMKHTYITYIRQWHDPENKSGFSLVILQ